MPLALLPLPPLLTDLDGLSETKHSCLAVQQPRALRHLLYGTECNNTMTHARTHAHTYACFTAHGTIWKINWQWLIDVNAL